VIPIFYEAQHRLLSWVPPLIEMTQDLEQGVDVILAHYPRNTFGR